MLLSTYAWLGIHFYYPGIHASMYTHTPHAPAASALFDAQDNGWQLSILGLLKERIASEGDWLAVLLVEEDAVPPPVWALTLLLLWGGAGYTTSNPCSRTCNGQPHFHWGREFCRGGWHIEDNDLPNPPIDIDHLTLDPAATYSLCRFWCKRD